MKWPPEPLHPPSTITMTEDDVLEPLGVALHALDLSGLRTGSAGVVIGCGADAKAVRDAPPDAVAVADRFHLVALANDMLTQVRLRVLRENQGRRGRKTDPAWAARRHLLTDTSGYGTEPLRRCGTH